MKSCKQFIIDHFDDFKRDLKGLIEIPSVTSDREKSVEALNYVIDLARSYGFNAFTTRGARVGVIEYGDGDETLGILAHVDVVQADASEWRFPPFTLTEHGGRLYGRGAIDDKGAVIMALYILKYFNETGVTGNKKIQLIIGTQEESEWDDMDAYRAELKTPDYGFTPDGEFPISNAEKGYIDLVLSFPAKSITSVTGGNAPNTVASSVTLTADGNEYIFTGKAAHSSTPWEGKNAIVKAAEELDGKVDEEVFRFIREVFDGDDYGTKLGLYKESYVNGNCINLTTLVPTLIAMEQGNVLLTVNVRTAFGTSNAEIKSGFEKAGKKYGFSVTELPYAMEAIYVDYRHEFLQLMKKTYDDIVGGDFGFTLTYGTSYAKALPNFVAFGPGFPGEADTAHQADEYIATDKMLLACEIYAEYMKVIISSKKSFKI